MNEINWLDALSFKADLVADGWRSPDTYDNHFAILEDSPAVYLLLLHKPFAKGWHGFEHVIVAYVGMSKKLKTRLSNHDVLQQIQTRDTWAMRWFKPTPAKSLREAEACYIRRFDPPWNTIGRPRGVVIQ